MLRVLTRSAPERIRVSIGTAAVLGLVAARLDAPPTTAYLLTGGGCLSTCAFCPQARSSASRADLLSRVAWPEFGLDDVLEALAAHAGGQPSAAPQPRADSPAGPQSARAVRLQGPPVGGQRLARVCVQVTQNPGARAALAGILSCLRSLRSSGRAGFDVSVSCHPSSLAEVEEVLSGGADRVGIPLDAASPAVYAATKSGSWQRTTALLEQAAREFPGRISSHLMVGLGETEKEAAEAVQRLVEQGISVGLFAFTPVRGTPMENVRQPAVGGYRRVQLARHLMVNALAQASAFAYEDGRITDFALDRAELLDIARHGEPFRTSGCPDCNRPYYNERPGGIIYNYPRRLSAAEAGRAIDEAGCCGTAHTGEWQQ